MKQQNKPLQSNTLAQRHKKSLYTLMLTVFLAACNGSSSGGAGTVDNGTGTSNPAGTTVVIIENEDRTAGLKGIDADNNGIRDDIDRLIAKKYALTPAMKKAAEQKARALQLDMEATTKAQARLAGVEIMRAGDCILKVFKTDFEWTLQKQMSKEIESLTANTRERFIAYWASQKLSGGMVFSQAEEPVCD